STIASRRLFCVLDVSGNEERDPDVELAVAPTCAHDRVGLAPELRAHAEVLQDVVLEAHAVAEEQAVVPLREVDLEDASRDATIQLGLERGRRMKVDVDPSARNVREGLPGRLPLAERMVEDPELVAGEDGPDTAFDLLDLAGRVVGDDVLVVSAR